MSVRSVVGVDAGGGCRGDGGEAVSSDLMVKSTGPSAAEGGSGSWVVEPFSHLSEADSGSSSCSWKILIVDHCTIQQVSFSFSPSNISIHLTNASLHLIIYFLLAEWILRMQSYHFCPLSAVVQVLQQKQAAGNIGCIYIYTWSKQQKTSYKPQLR